MCLFYAEFLYGRLIETVLNQYCITHFLIIFDYLRKKMTLKSPQSICLFVGPRISLSTYSDSFSNVLLFVEFGRIYTFY